MDATFFTQHPPILSLRAERFCGSPSRLTLAPSPFTGAWPPQRVSVPKALSDLGKDKGLLSPATGTSSIASAQAAPPPGPTKWLQIGG